MHKVYDAYLFKMQKILLTTLKATVKTLTVFCAGVIILVATKKEKEKGYEKH